jgi:hypothetical protein
MNWISIIPNARPLAKDKLMTVYDLRAKLSKFEGKEEVVVSWEDEQGQTQYFGIDEVSLRRGTSRRLPNGKPSFTFDGKGPAEWVFIEVSPE